MWDVHQFSLYWDVCKYPKSPSREICGKFPFCPPGHSCNSGLANNGAKMKQTYHCIKKNAHKNRNIYIYIDHILILTQISYIDVNLRISTLSIDVYSYCIVNIYIYFLCSIIWYGFLALHVCKSRLNLSATCTITSRTTWCTGKTNPQ